jgi:diguanylate cyclase (GGDEF)-like protein
MQTQEKFSILLVDDDSTVVRILSRILRDFAPLRFTTSGRAALKLARESIPDLVLLDVDMPDFSGFEVCKEFKSDAKLAEVPIIFITSHDSAQLEAKGLELGAADFISKPPHAPLVLARVRAYQRLKLLSDTLRSVVKMDFLTGTLTRRELEKALTQEWLRAQRSTDPLAFLVVDIEGFTEYNAECGEDMGDACLKSVADSLRSAARRPTDILGRWSGGQFGLLLPQTDAQGANAIARRAIAAVEERKILHAGRPAQGRVKLRIGGGCSDATRSHWSPGAAAVPNDLIAAAEQAFKSAKSSGADVIIIDTGSHDSRQSVSSPAMS